MKKAGIFLVIAVLVTVLVLVQRNRRDGNDLSNSPDVQNEVKQNQNEAQEFHLSPATNIKETQLYVNKENGYSILVPKGWAINTDSRKSDLVTLRPVEKKQNPATGYFADISISAVPNPLNLSIEEFYNRESFDIPKISRTHTYFQLNGSEAAHFEGVPGEISSTIVSLKIDDKIIEFVDINEGHQQDGIFDFIVSSLKEVKPEITDGSIPPYKTFKDLGITFMYPTFGRNSKIEVTSRDRGVQFVEVKHASVESAEHILVATFGILVQPNLSHKKIEEWFDENVDTNNILVKAGTFRLENFPDGRQMYIDNNKPVPAEYEGIVEYAYIMSPNKNIVVDIGLSQDHELDLLGVATTDQKKALLRKVVDSLTFY